MPPARPSATDGANLLRVMTERRNGGLDRLEIIEREAEARARLEPPELTVRRIREDSRVAVRHAEAAHAQLVHALEVPLERALRPVDGDAVLAARPDCDPARLEGARRPVHEAGEHPRPVLVLDGEHRGIRGAAHAVADATLRHLRAFWDEGPGERRHLVDGADEILR